MKKKPTKQTSPAEYDSQRETRVLLEEMNKGIKIIGEQHGSIKEEITQLRNSLEGRLDRVEMAVMEVDAKLNRQDKELQVIKTTTQASNSELRSVKTAIMEVDDKVIRVERKLDTTISQNEERFKKIEDKVGIA